MKELKDFSAVPVLALVHIMWNPVKELKVHFIEVFVDSFGRCVESGEGIESHSGETDDEGENLKVESGEGIESVLDPQSTVGCRVRRGIR